MVTATVGGGSAPDSVSIETIRGAAASPGGELDILTVPSTQYWVLSMLEIANEGFLRFREVGDAGGSAVFRTYPITTTYFALPFDSANDPIDSGANFKPFWTIPADWVIAGSSTTGAQGRCIVEVYKFTL